MRIFSIFKNNIQHLYFVIILLTALFLYSINFNSFQVGTYQDDASYIILAQSLVTGQGYTRINYPTPQPEVAWPPGYPILISPVAAISPFNFSLFKLTSIILTIMSIFVIKKYLELRTTLFYGLLVIALYAINLHTVRHATMVMTEPAYILWSLLAIYFFNKFEQENFTKWYHLPLLTFLLVLVSITRLIGGALAIAFLLVLLLKKDLKSSLILGSLYAIGMIPQFLLGRHAGGELFPPEVAEQVNPLENFSKILPQLQLYIVEHIPQYAFGLFGPTTTSLADRFGLLWLIIFIKWTLLALVFLGFFYFIRKRLTVSEIYFVVYFAIISIKTFDGINDTTPRYLFPLFPFIYLYLIIGLGLVASWLANRITHPIVKPTTFGVVIIPILIIFSVRGIDNYINPPKEDITDISLGATWIAANSDVDAIVMTQNPTSRYIYAQRHTTDFPDMKDTETLLQKIEEQQVSYILVAPPIRDPSTPDFDKFQLDEYQTNVVLPFISTNPALFQQVYQVEDKNVYVYKKFYSTSE